MASSNTNENTQTKTCLCGEGDKSIWNPKTPESSDKQPQKCPHCQILKSGFLFISSKGIGWTSWKKRWFILTPKSLIFYRTDPNALPQKGSEANSTLGGIDLNSSGSVVVKADKKLLTVFFPDGQDGRTFTLKGETSEELQEWKTALESALAQAPSATIDMGQNGIFPTEIANAVEPSFDQWQDRKPINSTVVGRPVILALEDVDGSPSFLEKALRFIEEYGIKVEGILRQSADVEEVERRVQEYEQGKNEFSADEDAHVIGDCIKHVLREMTSSPVPASCCTALVDAYRNDRGNRINAIRAAISETFPEPNLRLLQRILKMMAVVASHKSVNRMSLSALAACMAPLLLRPLLAGDCDFEDNFNMAGDGSIQLLKAAAAANHAQGIIIIMLEEHDRIFDEELSQDGSCSSEIYTDSEHYTEDDESADNNVLEDDEYFDSRNGRDADIDDDLEHSSSRTVSGSGSYSGSDMSETEETDGSCSYASSPRDAENVGATKTASSASDATISLQDIGQKTSTDVSLPQEAGAKKKSVMSNDNSDSAASPSNKTDDSTDNLQKSSLMQKSVSHTLPESPAKFKVKSNGPASSMRRPTKWGRTAARKDVPMESTDSTDDETAIQRLQTNKSDLETKITEEVKGNEVLRESLERRKEALHERRLALMKDVEILREQLEKERGLRSSLEFGLMNIRPGHVSISSATDSKTREDLEDIKLAEADIINLKHTAADLRGQLTNLQQPNNALLCISCKRQLDENEKNQERIIDSDLTSQDENPATSDHKMSHKKKDEVIDTLNNSTPRSENIKSGGSPNRKLPRQPTNHNKTKLNETSSTEEPITLSRNYASKRSSFRVENEKSSKSEDGAPSSSSSSSALTRLTNRLNLLKERRLQLANELQNLDAKGNSR